MQDRDILRKLAGAVAEAAALPCQKETAQLYRDVNGLKLVRPPVLLDELPWNQLEASADAGKAEKEYKLTVRQNVWYAHSVSFFRIPLCLSGFQT